MYGLLRGLSGENEGGILWNVTKRGTEKVSPAFPQKAAGSRGRAPRRDRSREIPFTKKSQEGRPNSPSPGEAAAPAGSLRNGN